MKYIKSLDEAKAKLHGGDAEDKARAEFAASAKQRFEALLKELEDEAYEIGGSFRGPGIIADFKSEVKKSWDKL